MAKKFGKVLLLTAALSAVAGGAYYYLKGRDALMDDDFFDDDDFDNFDDDPGESDSDRNYVNLDLNKAEDSMQAAKEDLQEGAQAAKEDLQEGLPPLLHKLTFSVRFYYSTINRGIQCYAEN